MYVIGIRDIKSSRTLAQPHEDSVLRSYQNPFRRNFNGLGRNTVVKQQNRTAWELHAGLASHGYQFGCDHREPRS